MEDCVVTRPDGAPTGQVFNNTTGFVVGANPARFIFASENGAIDAWNGGAVAAIVVPQGTVASAVYKGLAIDSASSRLYATDFHNNKVDVFDSSFAPVALGEAAFTDPSLPSGYAPFGIQNIGGKLYVSYALQHVPGAGHDDVAGPGNGFVDVYDTDGNLIGRLVSN